MALWNGRFRRRLHPKALEFSSSLNVDRRLYREDIEGSIAHVEMLAKQRIISSREGKKLGKALREIQREIERGKLPFKKTPGNRFIADDIHMTVENRLIQKLGDMGGKVHTARSRNDQVALDERLFLRRSIQTITRMIRQLQRTVVVTAEKHQAVYMPGYTHLQRAQPVLLAHHLLAYVSMLERDYERFFDCLQRVNRSPLGAGPLAGTSFPIDRSFVAKRLGLPRVIENSMDAVGDRDVQIEFLACCAMTMMHLSRFAEELVLWSSQEWSFVEMSDAFTTGSSIMPQKKNPDMAELVRGKSGRVFGNLMALLTVMKGLPLAYNRDMQEDKEPLFDSTDTVGACLEMCSLILKSAKFNRDRFDRELHSDLLLATDIADYLVRKGLPFRKAHVIVGRLVQQCLKNNVDLKDLPLEDYLRHSRLFREDIYNLLSPKVSLAQKKSIGSTSPHEVRKALRRWKKTLR